ncbi:FHA domain-containing protein [bacterium]|nr:FHA domain-containing protein [candidate division CSSED10-310 bacterium]
MGRSRECDLVIEEPRISKTHAQIRFGNGKFWIEDLDSRWGTTVNGTKIRTKILADGDKIDLASKVSCIFHTEPSDPVVEETVLDEEESETVLDIDIDWDAYKAEDLENLRKKHDISPRLIQIDDTGQTVVKYRIDHPVISIGRSNSNRIVLDHKTISRHHCEIVENDGIFLIRDLDSSNGIRINGKKVDKSEIVSGDMIQIGMLEFRFILPGTTTTSKPVSPIQIQRKSLADIHSSEQPEENIKVNIPWPMIIIISAMTIAFIVILYLTIIMFK